MTDRLAFPDARYRVRVGDLAYNHYVKVICYDCGHVAILRPAWFRDRFNDDVQIADIAPKFKCQACGLVGQRSWDTWAED